MTSLPTDTLTTSSGWMKATTTKARHLDGWLAGWKMYWARGTWCMIVCKVNMRVYGVTVPSVFKLAYHPHSVYLRVIGFNNSSLDMVGYWVLLKIDLWATTSIHWNQLVTYMLHLGILSTCTLFDRKKHFLVQMTLIVLQRAKALLPVRTCNHIISK